MNREVTPAAETGTQAMDSPWQPYFKFFIFFLVSLHNRTYFGAFFQAGGGSAYSGELTGVGIVFRAQESGYGLRVAAIPIGG